MLLLLACVVFARVFTRGIVLIRKPPLIRFYTSLLTRKSRHTALVNEVVTAATCFAVAVAAASATTADAGAAATFAVAAVAAATVVVAAAAAAAAAVAAAVASSTHDHELLSPTCSDLDVTSLPLNCQRASEATVLCFCVVSGHICGCVFRKQCYDQWVLGRERRQCAKIVR